MTATEAEPLIVRLDEAAGLARSLLGGKAANLARLAAAGLTVPRGVVVTSAARESWDDARSRVADAVGRLGAGPFAVRSSGVAEDLEGASFAGQYETLLGVAAADVPDAVRHVLDSAASGRVSSYRAARNDREPSGEAMAVLIQVMVDADAAGVSFSANPLTGARDEVVITAVRGLGERLVSGEAVGEQWVGRGSSVERRSGDEEAIDERTAREVTELTRRVARHFGVPQDIEWAVSDGVLYLLQARPMTALPAAVEWIPPYPGWWLRNLRLGEWLPDPVTPLFATWLLPRLDLGYAAATEEDIGIAIEPATAIINGWYYTTPQGRGPLRDALFELVRRPRALARMITLLLLAGRAPERADGLLTTLATRWREERLPAYGDAVRARESEAASAGPSELVAAIDEVGELAGRIAWSIASVAGSAWKVEGAFARFFQAHLSRHIDAPYQRLLIGLPGAAPGSVSHAVHSIDWRWPTAVTPPPDARVQERLRAEREEMEAACRAALAPDSARLARFDRLLEMAQRYAVIREQQTRSFTLGWPLLRQCALRLGTMLCERGAIASAEDVFFLERDEVSAALAADGRTTLHGTTRERRRLWDAQRRLAAPLEIGSPPALARSQMIGTIETARSKAPPSEGVLVGQPASPGRATGRVRIVTGPEEFARFEAGEVLVARATAPAWTPLFSRAVAVVTDGGTLAAHASLVAREFGIPAVVATGDATRRLHDGQTVTVDGAVGVVEVERER
ncbi:MAG: hypothetical protein KGJ98_09010 [Chloroflexota bacterium]|nr:hypothetical protein [Chloroflexota bacterium]